MTLLGEREIEVKRKLNMIIFNYGYIYTILNNKTQKLKLKEETSVK